MTEGSRASKDKYKSQAKRNRTTDPYGNRYDQRSGSWGMYDKAVDDGESIVRNWLTLDRCLVELSILNYPGKPGRKYEYPPSLIQYALMLKESDNKPYRKCPADCRHFFELLGLNVPCYKTIQNSAAKFFKGEFGIRVMEKASHILRKMGVTEDFDPVMFVRSGACPDYGAPQRIITCQRDLEDQQCRDAEAAEMRDMMEVMVSKNFVDGRRPVNGAIDGSGEGTSGHGIYMEHIWRLNDRKFIKQHVTLDVNSQQIVSFSTTLERPGDAKMLPPMMEGMIGVGVELVTLTADAAYDTVNNWIRATELSIEFIPNLKESFKDDRDLIYRHTLRLMEEKLGKEFAHRVTGYTLRWLVESFFSAFKRMYGDRLRPKLFCMMAIAMRMRYMLYTIHRTAILRRIDERGNWGFTFENGRHS